MKNKTIWTKCRFFIMLLSAMTVLLSCSSDDKDDTGYRLMKSWKLDSQTKDQAEVSLLPCEKENLLFFTTQNVCYSHSACTNKTIRTAWNYEPNTRVLNISDFLPVTYYVESVNDNSLVISYYKYSDTGVLEKYIDNYTAVETTLNNGKLELKP